MMASGGGASWNTLYHETTEPLDEWSQPGDWKCPASWEAFTGFPGSRIGGNSQTLTVTVVNPNCNCRAVEHNNQLRNQRTGPIGINPFDPSLPPWMFDSLDAGREYWNRVLQDSGSPVRVEAGYGIPMYVTPIAQANVAAQYTNVGGPERIEIDSEFFDDGWDPLVWDHLITHEVGHYLAFRHGMCGQTDTVMFSPVYVPAPGAPTNTGMYLGRFSATVANDRCYVYGEYRP